MGNSSIESNETWQDFTRLLGALGKRQLWKYATVALNQARPWDPCFAQVMRCFIQVMRNDEAFFLVDLDFIFGGSSGFINVTKKKVAYWNVRGFWSNRTIKSLQMQCLSGLQIVSFSASVSPRWHSRCDPPVGGALIEDVIALGAAVNACAGELRYLMVSDG